jgi:hypothetical protein
VNRIALGRSDALRAALKVCTDIAGGNAVGQRFSNEFGCGIASQTNAAIAASQQASAAFMTRLSVLGTCALIVSLLAVIVAPCRK